MKPFKVSLSYGDIEYILWLIEQNQREGIYYGNSQRFWSRVEMLEIKLKRELSERLKNNK